jgi:hypothetical protein
MPPPYRIIARHPDKSHHDHSWYQVGSTYDYVDEATDAIKDADGKLTLVQRPLDPDEPIRPSMSRLIDERKALGHEFKVQELVPEGEVQDDGSYESHVWKDVRGTKEDAS